MAVYGYVNGKAVSTRDEFIYESRRRGPITDDKELLAFAEKVTSHWYDSGWHRTFTTFYLSDYALSEPRASLTLKEYDRLKELQRQQVEAHKAAEEARQWRLTQTCCYADNSVEETWTDKDGNTRTVMTVAPHGDIC